MPSRSTSPRPTNFSHMRAGINFHRGPPASDVFSQQPIMEDPSSLLVDYEPHSQIPYSPLISEEPVIRGFTRPGVSRCAWSQCFGVAPGIAGIRPIPEVPACNSLAIGQLGE